MGPARYHLSRVRPYREAEGESDETQYNGRHGEK